MLQSVNEDRGSGIITVINMRRLTCMLSQIATHVMQIARSSRNITVA
jgi:hypothetical protein